MATPKKARNNTTGEGSPTEAPVMNTPAKRALSPDFHGKKGRSGPPKGSTNAAKHYMRAGKLPKCMKYIETRINGFKRHLEALVLDARGEVTVTDAAHIDTAAKWERHGCLALRWLRTEGENLKPSEKLSYSEAIAKASMNRDKAIEKLELNVKPETPWAIDADSAEVTDD